MGYQLKATGKLTFETEGNSYELASQNMADNTWHHVTLPFNRLGPLRICWMLLQLFNQQNTGSLETRFG
jgi:hypothetical protein